ncbi:MAG TPA: lysozyme inhibitor LprI family protein [Polaromonas sp.]|uniref:lysozyme inhibitor LprI family protein n=1 Tax=Polaromonas sp. TaxID=1869339 RepID=UPI002D4DE92A|nr:lysozyme inhibitor LprI family protein [Polaromonas sp.]HYW58516.1 lysozyme inhibitor LprI family protein [Polaromonas sp.]
MNVTDELLKLNELKDKGALTQDEFDIQKGKLLSGGEPVKPKKKSSGLIWKIPLAVIGVSIGLIGMNSGTDKIKQSKSETDQSETLAKSSVSKSPLNTVAETVRLPDGSTVTKSQAVPLWTPQPESKQEDDLCSNSKEPMECLNKEFAEADSLLNATYKQVMARMDASQQGTLKKQQQAWISEKEDKCEKAGAENAGSQLERLKIAKCMVRTTEQRTSYLAGLRL